MNQVVEFSSLTFFPIPYSSVTNNKIAIQFCGYKRSQCPMHISLQVYYIYLSFFGGKLALLSLHLQCRANKPDFLAHSSSVNVVNTLDTDWSKMAILYPMEAWFEPFKGYKRLFSPLIKTVLPTQSLRKGLIPGLALWAMAWSLDNFSILDRGCNPYVLP